MTWKKLRIIVNGHRKVEKNNCGQNHVDVAKSYNNLAKGYRNAGYLGKAKDYYEQALMIQKEQLGPNHVDVAESYNKRAKVYRINTSDGESQALLLPVT